MKTWRLIAIIVVLAVTTTLFAAPKSGSASAVPKYNPATEVTIKGTVVEITDRNCPVSGGMGSHVTLKLADGSTIEVHLATTKFVKTYDLELNKGDELEVTGSKVTFEGAETIFAREIKRGQDTFVFRDKEGKPVW